jgi:hypothetical protein
MLEQLLNDGYITFSLKEHFSESYFRLKESFDINKINWDTLICTTDQKNIEANKVEGNIIDKDYIKGENLEECCSNIIKNNVDLFKQKVETLNNNGAIVCGYTASAKSTVLLNFAKIKNGQIKAIADDAVEKQNHFLLGPNIPITSIENVLSLNPTDIIVFSWNIYDEIKNKIFKMGYKDINVWVWNK